MAQIIFSISGLSLTHNAIVKLKEMPTIGMIDQPGKITAYSASRNDERYALGVLPQYFRK